MQFRDMPELEPRRQFPAQVPGGVIERGHGLVPLLLVAAKGHFDGGVPGIRTDLDVGHVHVQEPGIVQLKGDDLAEFLLHRFGDP